MESNYLAVSRSERFAGTSYEPTGRVAHSERPSDFTPRPRLKGESLLTYGRRIHAAEMQRLKMKHRSGLGGGAVVAGRSSLMDFLLGSIISGEVDHGGDGVHQVTDNGCVIALGGYGRGELAPYSDVDLMFLRKGKLSSRASGEIQSILCLLWDMGFQVGHSVRSLKESQEMAQQDLVSMNSMLDARFMVGDKELFAEFQKSLQRTIKKRHKPLQEVIWRSVQERHESHGGTAFIQEPDVKEAKGGLRDFHTIHWIAKGLFPNSPMSEVLNRHAVAPVEWKRAHLAYEFLLRLRNELHFMTDRRTDVLSHHHLASVIRSFDIKKGRFEKDSEAFLKYYYLQARRIAQVLEVLLAPLEKGSRSKSRWLSAKLIPFSAGKAALKVPIDKNRGPEHWMRVFRYSQNDPALVDLATKADIRRNLQAFKQNAFASPGISSDLRAILRAKGKVAVCLRQMHGLGFLGRILPEFGRLTCLVQHDLYHKYTTDEHTLRALDVLDRIASGTEARFHSYKQIMNEIHDASSLYFAVLMHDVGKGLGGGHSAKGAILVGKALHRLGFDPDESEKIQTLVRHHLLMGHVSQRRNLDEVETIEEFVAVIGRLDILNMLLLLTYADAQAVGPGVWTEWKDYCLWELYHRAYDRLMLTKSAALNEEIEKARREIINAIGTEVTEKQINAHLRQLPKNYVLYTPVSQIVDQLRLVSKLEHSDMVLEWVDHPDQGYCDLILVTRDHPGLFAEIAGGLSAFNLNILSAQLNTRGDGLVCDVFQVGSLAGTYRLHHEDYPRVERLLKKVITGQTNIEDYVKAHAKPSLKAAPIHGGFPPRIRIDNSVSPFATVIEIQAEDRLGLGYQIARTLSSAQLNIVFAKLSTEKSHAFDVFYVCDKRGNKVVEAQRLKQLEEQLREDILKLS